MPGRNTHPQLSRSFNPPKETPRKILIEYLKESIQELIVKAKENRNLIVWACYGGCRHKITASSSAEIIVDELLKKAADRKRQEKSKRKILKKQPVHHN